MNLKRKKRWYDRHGFDKAVQKAGIVDFRFHDLRHCAINNLRLAGNDHFRIKKVSGHKTDIAFQRYNLVTEEAKTIRESIDTSQKRRDTMRRNFLSLYKVDIDDRSNFDLLLDTSSLSSAEVFERVSTFIDEQTSNI